MASELLAQGSALGGMTQDKLRPARAKAFALTARKLPRIHNTQGDAPGYVLKPFQGTRGPNGT